MSSREARVFYRSCNFCGGLRFRVFHRIPRAFPERIYGDVALSDPAVGEVLSLQYLQCTGCELVAVGPLPRFDDVNRRRFDGERNLVAWADLDYDFYERDKRSTIAAVYETHRLERFRKHNRILDVSCGPGVSLAWLAHERGWQAAGVDPDAHSARVARERYGVEVETGLLADLSAPDEHFDCAILDNSLEHTFDPLGTLLEVWRVLRPGGGVFIAVPNAEGVATRSMDLNAHWGHWFLFTPRVLYRALSRIGFRVTTLFARQRELRPELTARGVRIEDHREALDVALEGEAEVATIESTPARADFFHVVAEKPPSAPSRPAQADSLAAVAAASLREREAVEIEGEAGDGEEARALAPPLP